MPQPRLEQASALGLVRAAFRPVRRLLPAQCTRQRKNQESDDAGDQRAIDANISQVLADLQIKTGHESRLSISEPDRPAIT